MLARIFAALLKKQGKTLASKPPKPQAQLPRKPGEPNFTLGKQGELENDVKVSFEMDKWAKSASGIATNKPINANFSNLARKHPEMYKSPAQAYKNAMEIKNEPTLFLKNKRDDVALMAKDLGKNKMGKMGIRKEDNELIHLIKIDKRSSDIKPIQTPLQKAQDLAVEPPTHSTPMQSYIRTLRQSAKPHSRAGAKAHSLGDKDSTQKSSKSQDLLPTERE